MIKVRIGKPKIAKPRKVMRDSNDARRVKTPPSDIDQPALRALTGCIHRKEVADLVLRYLRKKSQQAEGGS